MKGFSTQFCGGNTYIFYNMSYVFMTEKGKDGQLN